MVAAGVRPRSRGGASSPLAAGRGAAPGGSPRGEQSPTPNARKKSVARRDSQDMGAETQSIPGGAVASGAEEHEDTLEPAAVDAPARRGDASRVVGEPARTS